MYNLTATDQFLKRAGKFFKKHPELKDKFAAIAEKLQLDPLQPTLQLHPLKGKLQGLYAVRLTQSYRLTLTIKISQHEIILLDIGSHDEVYR